MSKVGLAFNGGKESLVVLHQNLKLDLVVFTIQNPNDFPEIIEYVNYIEKLFGISILRYLDIKDAILDIRDTYGCKTIIMGNRRTDPGCANLNTYTETDGSYPLIMRYNPLIDWTYHQVWNYIEENELPVCPLYENGFTSIGHKLNTFPNYLLFDPVLPGYKHAKYLDDANLERIGRIKINLPLKFSGTIVRGQGLGKQVGFPTANIHPELHPHLPDGVYYGEISIYGTKEKMIMSVGKNIHFDSVSSTIEIHIIQLFQEDFYGDQLEINVLGFIRQMAKFSSTDDLVKAIQHDIEIANYSITFNT
jgi:hypothetical protein